MDLSASTIRRQWWPFLAVGACLLFLVCAAPSRAAAPDHSLELPPINAQAAEPSVTLLGHRRCSSRTVVVTPSYFGDELFMSVLFVKGRRVKTIFDATREFKVGARKFKAGRNHYEVVSVFASGKSASATGVFRRCSRRR